MTYTTPEGVSIGTFTADTLPASFSAPADAAVSYKIYGTEAGAGIATENLLKMSDLINAPPGVIVSTDFDAVLTLTLKPNTTYTLISNGYGDASTSADADLYRSLYFNGANRAYCVFDGRPVSSTSDSYGVVKIGLFTSRTNAQQYITGTAYACLLEGEHTQDDMVPYGYQIPLSVEIEDQTQDHIVYIGASQLSDSEYVDYDSGKIYKLQEGVLIPTDPPAQLPTITASGETTISTSETLGDIELTGDWTAVMGSTQAESIDIDFTVDADEYIAFVTVDDDPQIQVTDTITMPSSADSFTLEVVSWGRERYTETVYSALS